MTPTATDGDSPSLLNQPTDGKEQPKVEGGAPESYADFKAPEGYEIDKAVIDEAAPIFKKFNLSQEQAQELVDLYSKHSIAAQEAALQAWKDTQDAWVREIKADPEIGGKLDLVKTTTSRAIDSVLGPELGKAFKQAMDITGAGNNPAFVKSFFKIAGLLTEGTHVPGHNPSPNNDPARAGRTPAERMYPNLARS